MDIPTVQTYGILGLFSLSLFIGGYTIKFVNVKESGSNKAQIDKAYDFIFKFCFYSLFIVLFFLSIKATNLLLEVSGKHYKDAAFSTTDYVGKLFNSRNLENLYFFISSPLLFFVAIDGLVNFLKTSRFKKLILAFLVNIMDAYIRLARVNVYMLILLFVLVMIFSNFDILALIQKKRKQFITIFIAFLGLLVVGFSRGYSPTQQIKMFTVDYHTVGFALFDHELKDPTSPLNTTLTYGRLTIGGLETCLTIIIRQFNKNYYTPALSNAIRMASHDILVGKIRYNSFYTLLYTFYSDGRYFGIIIGGFLFGFSLNYFQKRWKTFNQTRDAMYVILIFSVLIMSIFISQLEIMRTWMIAVLLILIDILIGNYDKKITKK